MELRSVALGLLLCAASAAATTPTSRVVDLLKGLSVKIEEEGKVEEDLYFKFVCWGENIITEKTKSNAAAQARVDELTAYIADVKAGKLEFTTEAADLEKQVATLSAKLKVMTDTRNREKDDYEAAQEEMLQAIAALRKALEVMKESTALTQTGSLLAMRQTLNEGFKQSNMDSASLDLALEMGRRYLTRGDEVFLQRVLLGEVPKADWKKLNRKAVFKMKYKSRSGKIVGILEQLLVTFTTARTEAKAREEAAAEIYFKLKSALDLQLDTATTALNDMVHEGAAFGLTLEQCEGEIKDLEKQIDADNRFIAQTQTSLTAMKAEYKDRKKLRAGELAAISKAIAVLASDNARDTLKSSYESQGYSLIQLEAGVALRARNAGEVLDAVAKRVGDRRLLAIATRVALQTAGHFDEVLNAIDKMIASLKEEGKSDLVEKEDCEKTRAEKTREAIVKSREVDEITTKVGKLLAEVTELKSEIAEKKATIADLNGEIKTATTDNELRVVEFKKEQMMDKQAVELIEKAKNVLETFYKENDLVLLMHRQPQMRAEATPPPSTLTKGTAGQAPPPPPSTWEQPYGGKSQESMGIVMILSMLSDDIHADIAKAVEEEDQALAEYKSFMKETKAQIADLDTALDALEATMSSTAMEMEDQKDIRSQTAAAKGAVMKTYKDLEPNCDFYATNFVVRSRNRDLEISGLFKAKGILEGAAFR